MGLEGRGAPRLRRREVEDRRRRGAEGARPGRGRDCQARAGVQRPAMDGMVKQRDHRKRPAEHELAVELMTRTSLASPERGEVIRRGELREMRKRPSFYATTL